MLVELEEAASLLVASSIQGGIYRTALHNMLGIQLGLPVPHQIKLSQVAFGN
jgi:hypothetical protein